MNQLLIVGAKVLDPSQNLDQVADVLVEGGKISKIQPNLAASVDKSIPIIKANGLTVSPGWVDIHTHLRDPGAAHKETIKTGSEAGAAGGYTTIACMANTKPVNDNSFVTSYIYQQVSKHSPINVFAIGAITKGLEGQELAEIGSMWESGIVGVSDDGKTLMNSYLMRKALDYSKRFNLVVISHCEDTHLKGKGVMNEGFNSTRFGLRGNPKAAEELIVARDILLAELTGGKLHIAHVSTAGSVALIRDAKRKGIRVTAEVTPHHLSLTDEAVGNYDTNTKVAPPLREAQDLEALAEALSDGTIDALATDHAPHSVEDKDIEYDLAEFGMIGLETSFPVYRKVCQERGIGLKAMISAMTENPAKIIGVPKGTLKIGADADITIFNPEELVTIDKRKFHSKSQNTPFDGWKVPGKIYYTIVAGKVVYKNPNIGVQ